MKLTLPRFERSTVFVVIGALLLAVVYAGLVNYAQEYYETRAPSSSVFSQQPGGLSVLYRYLDELGLEPKSLETWEKLPGTATIIAVAPFANPPTPAESLRTQRWVRAGGRLVLVGVEAGLLLAGESGAGRSQGDTFPLEPRLPSPYSFGVRRIEPGNDRLLPSSSDWVDHYGDISGKVLMSRAFGRGQVIWLAGTYPLANEGIGRADNARLATMLTAGVAGRGVYFDEYHHGYVTEASAWDRMSAGGKWALLLTLLGVAVLLAARGRRIGPVVPELEEPEARTGAYIGQLAELYRKAGTRADALLALEEGLRRSLAKRHGTLEIGLRRNPAAAEALDASRRLRERGKATAEEFVTASRRLGRARREVEG